LGVWFIVSYQRQINKPNTGWPEPKFYFTFFDLYFILFVNLI